MRKSYWLLLFAVLMTILSPYPLLAQEEKVDLTLTMAPGSYYREVTRGKDNTLFLEIRNTGNTAITNISLYSDKPKDWVVEFKPGSIDYLGASSSQTVDIIVNPAGNATRGEYTITLIAEAKETRRVITTSVRVETGTPFWLWVGSAVAVLVVAAFVIIFVRFGRE